MKILRVTSFAICAALAGAYFAGCASSDVGRSTGEYIDDQTINARVKTALLRDESVAGFDVSTTTFDGVVQLSGFVETEEQRQHAEQLAMGIDGVLTVINNISVNPRTQQQYGAPRDSDLEQSQLQ